MFRPSAGSYEYQKLYVGIQKTVQPLSLSKKFVSSSFQPLQELCAKLKTAKSSHVFFTIMNLFSFYSLQTSFIHKYPNMNIY